jgi:hypothetical protein
MIAINKLDANRDVDLWLNRSWAAVRNLQLLGGGMKILLALSLVILVGCVQARDRNLLP